MQKMTQKRRASERYLDKQRTERAGVRKRERDRESERRR